MFKKYADEFREDLKEFREITKKFYNKEISVVEYKGFSGGFGSYAQRGGDAGMLRLRLCGGRISKEQLEFISSSMKKYNINRAHCTTCQTIQLHNLQPDTIMSLIEEAWDHGIITRGGGGDFPRNVMATPLTGLEKDEFFDVTPYVDAAADYLLTFIKKVKLPRKLKVCFSSNPKNITHATFRDLGFVATKDGTFDVYSAGGLGINPMMGVKVDQGVDPAKTLYYVKAMVDTFTTYGNYEQRAKSRSRFIQEKLGPDGYVQAFQDKLKEAFATESLDLDVTPVTINKTGDGTISHERVVEQKQAGLYAVHYHPLFGDMGPEKVAEIYETIKDMPEVEIRLAPDESLYVVNLTADEAQKVLEITDDGSKTLFETSVACVGAHLCQVGIGDSPHALKLCLDAVREQNFADGVLPKIYISGCPSSCSGHQIGTIAFRGGMKRTDQGPKPAFAMYQDGCEKQGEERFGKEIGVILVDDMPTFFVELGQTIQAANSTYSEWITDNQDKFLEIANKYI